MSRPARHLQAVPGRPPVDLHAAEEAARDLLVALGADLQAAGLRETPRRIAHAYAELLTPVPFNPTTFPNDEGYDQLVVARSLPVTAVCEHHLLPFVGVAHVGYLPGERILGLSKLARVVEFYARRAQTQERLTRQVAEHLESHLEPLGVGVVVDAEHTCMTLRGAGARGSRTVTSALLGQLRENPSSRSEFLGLTRAQ